MVNPVISFAGLGCIDNSDRSMDANKITENNIGKRNHASCEDTYTYKKEYGPSKSIGKSIGGRF